MRSDEVSPELVATYYDEWTSRYQVSFGDTFQACRPTETSNLHRYIIETSGMQPGERVLDAGCGVCGPSIYFATHRNVMIDALTVSPAQVAAARRAVGEAGLGNQITVHLGDFHKLHEHFPEATFDRVLFLESLSHAADPTGPLQSAFHVLKPGGVVYIKDFFAKGYDSADKQQFVQEIIARVNRAFMVKTPILLDTVSILKQIKFVEQYTGAVEFINDIAVWAKFNQAHDFNLYDGKQPIEWCDWLELRFQKPFDTSTAE